MPQNKYAELLAIIEEIGKEIRPTYAGSKSAMERLKRGKAFKSSSARFLVLAHLKSSSLQRNNPRQRAGARVLGRDGEKREVLAADEDGPGCKNN